MAGKKITREVKKTGKNITRREVIKKAAYVTPVILTLAAKPSIARAGSPISKTSAKGKNSKGKYSKGKYSKSFEVGYSKTSGKSKSSKGSRVRVSYGHHSWGKSK